MFDSEQGFQQAVIDLAHLSGYLVYHPFDSRRSTPGWPDLSLVRPSDGDLLFRELKTARGRVTPEQQRWIDALQAAGADVAVWRPADWPEIVERLKRRQCRPSPTVGETTERARTNV